MSEIAVILGLHTNGLSVVRALGKHDIPVVILQSKDQYDSYGSHTKYGEKYLLNSLMNRELTDFLKKLEHPCLLFPTTDSQVSWLSENRAELPSNVRLAFPDKSVVRLLINKQNFFSFCTSGGFPIADYLFASDADLDIVGSASLTFPAIVKTPEKTYKKELSKAYIVHTHQELIDLYNRIRQIHHEFIIQEFIPGTDNDVCFCMQYISRTGDLLASFTGRKIRQWRPSCGGTASCEPAYAPELHDLTYRIFRAAGFWGIGSMEYKKDSRKNRYYIIEPTVCRTDFQEGAAIANGVNIPWIAYLNAFDKPVKPVIQNEGRISWMHVMNDRLSADYYIRTQKLTRLQWLWSLRHVRSFDLFDLQDIRPAIELLKEKVKRRMRF